MPVRNDPDGLAASLEAIGDAGAVIVVDDGSEPAITPAQASSARLIRLLVAGGPAAARNTGWRQATTGIVGFLDADCVPVSDWLERLLTHFADPEVVAVAPRIQARAGPATPTWLAGDLKESGRLSTSARTKLRCGRAASSRTSRRRRCWSAGKRSPRPAVSTRSCASARTWTGPGGWEKGRPYPSEPAVTVTHPARKLATDLLRQRFQYGRSAAALESRHGQDAAVVATNVWSARLGGPALTGATPGRRQR